MATTTPARHELVALLRRAAADDVEAFGDFFAATCPKAAELLGALGCTREGRDEVLLACYRDAWADRASYAASGLSPLAWLLVRVRDTATRGGALPLTG